MKKKILIVGGGLAGLSAGIYAQKCGFESEIYEKHSLPGGQCTGWYREGCFIDGCLDWLTGSSPNCDFYQIWKQLGALGDDIKVLQMPHFGVFCYDGVAVTLWQNLERTRQELLQLSPEDTALINRFIDDCLSVQTMQQPCHMPMDMLPLQELMKLGKSMAGAGSVMKAAGRFTCREYAQQYRNPVLRRVFSDCMPEGYSFYSFIFSYGIFCSGNGGLPEGGSLAFSRRIAQRYQQMGGVLHTGAGVTEICISGKRADGLRLENGSVVTGDYVICACDVHHVFATLLHGKYRDAEFERRFAAPDIYSLPTCAMAAFKIDADISELPHKIYFGTEPLTIGKTTFTALGMKHFCYEPSFAPAGCSVALVTMCQRDADYAAWEALAQDEGAYRAEKQRIAREVIRRITAQFPQLSGKISCIDVASPLTYTRYTNAYHGAWMSFMMTPKAKMMMHKGLIKGLDNVLLAGMWLQPPGGTPVAAVTGKFAVQRICRREKMPYDFM